VNQVGRLRLIIGPANWRVNQPARRDISPMSLPTMGVWGALITRPPVAIERLSLTPQGNIRYALKT
jgi:hypothetical protein